MKHIGRSISIGMKRREGTAPKDYTSMIGMPTPTGWGERIKPAGGRNNFRLEKGEIRFERLYVRIFPEIPILQKPIEDKVIGRLSDDVRRPILPLEEESPGLDPQSRRRVPVPEEIEDYRRPGESDAIYGELLFQMRTLSFRLLAGTIISLFLGAIELLTDFGVAMPPMLTPQGAPVMYLSLNILLAGFCLFLCRRVYIGGFSSIIKLRPDGDGVITIACTAAMLQMIAELIVYFVTRQPVHRVCAAPMVTALVINDLGLYIMTRRIARNFRFVALRGVRCAARLVGNDMSFDEILHADMRYRSCVAYCIRTKFLSKYLKFAYEEDFCEQMTDKLTPYVIFPALAAAVVGGLVGFKTSGIWSAVYCFTAVMLIGIPSCRMLCLNLPMNKASKVLLRRGAMLNGWASVDEFCRVDTLAVGADVLFPRGTVRLMSIKAFGEQPLDRTVLYAASVVLAAGGPLAQVFDELLEGRRDRVLPAEGIDYENEMGVSGFVESLPVLVGNRRMLRLHGCLMPSKDYEELLTSGDNRSLVYIAISGVPCAVLMVKYSADANTIASVQRMAESGVGLVVYTCDANVTAKMLSSLYCIPVRHITMLSTRAGSEYDRLTHVIKDSAPAVLATDGTLRALTDGMTAAKRLYGLLTTATMIQMVAYGLMLTLVTVLCCVSGSAGVGPGKLMLLQCFCLLSSLASLFRRVL